MANRNTALDDELRAYLVAHSARETAAQVGIREATRSHPAGGMQIGPEQAQFLGLLVKLIGARRAIEIGVFTGYSALAVALALPEDGRLLACDISDEYTRVGRPFWEAGGRRPQDRPAARAGARHARCAHRRRRGGQLRLRLHRCRQVGLRRLLRALPASCCARAA